MVMSSIPPIGGSSALSPQDLEPRKGHHVRAKDLALLAALVVSAYVLIAQLADIGFGTIAHELREAEPAWLILGLILAQCTFVAGGIAVRGTVTTPLALLPCVLLQSAIKFVNLTVPSSAGRIGMNLRFLQQMGVPRPRAIAAGTIDDVAKKLVQIGLLLLALPLVKVRLDTTKLHGPSPDSRLVAAIGVAIIVTGVVMLAVPKFRARIVPAVRNALSGIREVARIRHKRLELFGGRLAVELLYTVSLGATCLAYDIDLNLAQLVFVNTAAGLVSGLIPSPGGIGAAEASISAGLIAVGVDNPTAIAIAVTQRLWTFYLPPIWGYASLRWLTRKGFV
jgi:uncharacterized membrane protein YbhN (UPF0104 family)